jgi:hypothetical protein
MMPSPEEHRAYYMHVVPNSHCWLDLETLCRFIAFCSDEESTKCLCEGQDFKHYVLIGLNNTLKQGYDFIKKDDWVEKSFIEHTLKLRIEDYKKDLVNWKGSIESGLFGDLQCKIKELESLLEYLKEDYII